MLQESRQSPVAGRYIGALCCLAAATLVWAHEGHEALPKKGVSVKGNTVALTLDARNAIGLTTTDVLTQLIERAILAPVVVELLPGAHAFATTQLSGRVEQVLVKPGQTVQAGEVLAWVQSSDLERLGLDATTADLDLRLSQAELERVEDLAKSGIRNPRELLTARNKFQERTNAQLVARLKLRALGLPDAQEPTAGPGPLPIRAPLTGIVGHVDIVPGAIVDPQQHLFDIVDVQRLRLRAEIPEAYVPLVEADQEAAVHLRGQPRNAKPIVTRIASRERRIDPRKLAETMWLHVPAGASGLRPGMAGQARIVVERRPKALVVPDEAVVRDGIETYVFVQTQPPTKTQPGLYDRKHVTLGLSDSGRVELKTGVFSIDAVVIKGQRQLATLFVQGVLRPTPEARRNYGLRAAPVSQQKIGEILSLDAQLELPPEGRAVVAAPLPGKVVAVRVTQPGPIEPDAPLIELASLEFQNLQLDLIQAELAARLHRGTLESYAKVDPPTAIPRQLILEAETQLSIAQARVDSLSRRLAALGLSPKDIDAIRTKQQTLASFWLRAPRGGQILPQELALGQVVKEGTPLFEIQDRSRFLIRGRVFDHELARLQIGQPARLRLTSQPGYLAEARIARIESITHQGGLTRSVWGEVEDADGRLEENQLGRLTITTGAELEALAVPLSALFREGTEWRVFIYEPKKDVFTPRLVELGRRDDRFAEIRNGLQAGEEIAVTAVADLRRGFGRVK